MPVIEESIDIHAPIDRVFAELSDPRRAHEWNPAVGAIREVSPLPVKEGTTWQQTTNAMGQSMNLTCRVVEFQPPHLGTIHVSGDQTGRIVTRCQPIPGGTRVTESLDFELPGGFLGQAMAGMIRGALQRELRATLERQRATLERELGAESGSGTA